MVALAALDRARGELLTLLGPSARQDDDARITPDCRPTADMRINGRDAGRLPPNKRSGHGVPELCPAPHLTVADNIAFGMKQRGIEGRAGGAWPSCSI